MQRAGSVRVSQGCWLTGGCVGSRIKVAEEKLAATAQKESVSTRDDADEAKFQSKLNADIFMGSATT
eukprot:2515131-Rhodomonas_salina.1